MIKILIILPCLEHDGVTNGTLLYLENMDRTNLDICIGVGEQCNEKEQINRVKALNIPIQYLPNRSKETLKYCVKLKNYLRENSIDIIHVMGNSATMAVEMTVAWRCNVPVRLVHCRNTQCRYKICNFLLKPALYRFSTGFLACGEMAGRYLYGNRKFTIVPNGKNIERYLFDSEYRKSIRKEMQSENKIIIGHVGKFVEAKNHKFLLEIFNRLSKKADNYELWLVGDGEDKKQEICQQMEKYGLTEKVKFLGFRNDVEKLLSAMDIMVFPSLYEGLPNVVIEWQIAGLPCFLSDTITKECKVMDNVEYLSLDKGAEYWSDKIRKVKIEERDGMQYAIKEKMKLTGYDIKRNAETLKKIYMRSIKEKNKY